MKLVIQRVKESNLKIDGNNFSSIGNGMVILIGISKEDDTSKLKKIVTKLSNLRIFNDEFGKMNKNINDIKGEILVVSQFTLYADIKKGNRPSFTNAAKPIIAINIYQKFIDELQAVINTKIKTGQFGADMKIELINDGPVTIILEN
ncbi:MAG: D-aminoacyl-tRNA deacylase [Flavobacteriaceae bacterium]|nr:D-tyrosyl-tRNA(Tyr) deacylase [Flavobacteriales bacterium]RCL69965.1 MAG: D-tyrosyl-tRNA(Tyr) deacylase [Bacteroidota bacterium]